MIKKIRKANKNKFKKLILKRKWKKKKKDMKKI